MHFLHPAGLLKLLFRSNWAQKAKISIYEISRMLFSHIDFNFAHFAHFNVAYFEIEESFRLIWVKLQMVNFTSKFLFRVFIKCLF